MPLRETYRGRTIDFGEGREFALIEDHYDYTTGRWGMHAPYDAGFNRQCGTCIANRSALARVLRSNRQAAAADARLCHTCLEFEHPTLRVIRRCLNCNFNFCRRGTLACANSHFGRNWCAGCGVFHSSCYTITRHRECGEPFCNTQIALHRRTCRPQPRFPDYREVTLTFNGEVGSHPKALGSRFVGFEIECEAGNPFILPSQYGIVDDGSLSRGLEILTPPSRGAELVDVVQTATSVLDSAGWEVDSGRCGLHTHIDLRDKQFDYKFLGRLFMLGYAFEDILYGVQDNPDQRRFNHYSRTLRSSYNIRDGWGPSASDFEYTYNKLRKSDYGSTRRVRDLRGTKWGENRYYGWNFHSVFYRGTIEVRIHEGSLDADRMLGWAELLQAIIKRAERGYVHVKPLERFMDFPLHVQLAELERILEPSQFVMDYLTKHLKEGR